MRSPEQGPPARRPGARARDERADDRGDHVPHPAALAGLTTLVDSDVLLDVLTEDAEWFDWSAGALRAAADAGRLAVNPIVCAEVSLAFARAEEVGDALPPDVFARVPVPPAAVFLAGKCYLAYRRAGGDEPVFPAFCVGAHAAVEGMRLLTRSAAPYRALLPSLELVTPGP